MRRSISRKRRSTTRDNQEPLHRTLPRLLVDDNDADSDLPTASPTSAAARRQLRKQLFGLDAEVHYDHVASTRLEGPARHPSIQISRSAKSSLELQQALGVLQQLTKTSSREGLGISQQRLRPNADDVRTSSELADGSLERTLTRRKSMHKPGEATRIEVKVPGKKQSSNALDLSYDDDRSATSDDNGLLALVRPSFDRAITPADLDRAYLGAYQIGSLRVINGLTPSPAPLHTESSVQMNGQPVSSTTTGYFDEARPISALTPDKMLTADEDQDFVHTATHLPMPIGSSKPINDATPNASTQDTAAALIQGQSMPPTRNPVSKPARLVGHRRHAHQRANTVDLTFDETTALASQRLDLADIVDASTEQPENLLLAAEDATEFKHNSPGAIASYELSAEHSASDTATPSYGSPTSEALPALSRSSTTDTSSDYSPGSQDDSAYASKASFTTVNPQYVTTLCRQDTVIVHVIPKNSEASIGSVYTLEENTSSETIQAAHPNQHPDGTLAALAQPTNSSSSSLSSAPRAESAGLPFRPQVEPSRSTQSLPTPSLSPVGPRKLQKKQPLLTTTPLNEIIVQRSPEITDVVTKVPEALSAAHSTRLSENPGMDHLEKTFKTIKQSQSHDSLASTMLLMPMVPIRFPSPTPTEEIVRRDSPASPKVRSPEPQSPDRTRKGFFSNFSRGRTKSTVSSKKKYKDDKYEEPEISIADLGDVVGALGSSPYDAASTRKTSTSQSIPGHGKHQPLLHPHQISNQPPSKSTSKGMSAEAATALAQLRSRDRPAQQYGAQKYSPSRRPTQGVTAIKDDKSSLAPSTLPVQSSNTVPALETSHFPALPSEQQQVRPKALHAGLPTPLVPLAHETRNPPGEKVLPPPPSASAPPAPSADKSDWSASTRLWRLHRQSLQSSLSADTTSANVAADAPPPVPAHQIASPSKSASITTAPAVTPTAQAQTIPLQPVPVPPAHTPRPLPAHPRLSMTRTPPQSPTKIPTTSTSLSAPAPAPKTTTTITAQAQQPIRIPAPAVAFGASLPAVLAKESKPERPTLSTMPTTWSLDLDLGDAFVFDV